MDKDMKMIMFVHINQNHTLLKSICLEWRYHKLYCVHKFPPKVHEQDWFDFKI